MDKKLLETLDPLGVQDWSEVPVQPAAKPVDNVDYASQAMDFIKKHEGFRNTPYDDTAGNKTVGYGFNLNAPETKSLAELHGYSEDTPMTEEVGGEILKNIFAHKEGRIKKDLPGVYDNLPAGQKTALMSLYYNSPALIGPRVKSLVSSGDSIGLAKEILTNSNKHDDLGILKRRLDEASQVHNLEDVNKILSSQERQRIKQVLEKSKNENVKREILEQYGQVLNLKPAPLSFTKLLK